MFHRRNKYNAQRVSHSGYSFASKLEAGLFDILTLRVNAGEITDLRHQHTIRFECACCEHEVTWRVDFSFLKSGVLWFAEAKGMESPDYIVKRNLWKTIGPGPLEIWKSSGLVQTIFPKYPKLKLPQN